MCTVWDIKGRCVVYIPCFITELPGSVKVARLETFSSSHLFLGISAVLFYLLGPKVHLSEKPDILQQLDCKKPDLLRN